MNNKKTYTVLGATSVQQQQSPNDLSYGARFTGTEKGLQVSDGYHTMDDLYEHRFTLYIAMCKLLASRKSPLFPVWRSKKHSDGEDAYKGWFVLGVNKAKGTQITYHIPLDQWDKTEFAETLEKAPEYDEHTSEDVLTRIKEII